MDKICGKCQYWCRKCASCSRGKISHCLDERDCWEEPTNETHLEGTEWHALDQRGFPDAVIFANNGNPLDGTYKIRRYVPEVCYQQLERVAGEMLNQFNVLRKMKPDVFDKIAKADIEDSCLIFSEKLEELGVVVDG